MKFGKICCTTTFNRHVDKCLVKHGQANKHNCSSNQTMKNIWGSTSQFQIWWLMAWFFRETLWRNAGNVANLGKPFVFTFQDVIFEFLNYDFKHMYLEFVVILDQVLCSSNSWTWFCYDLYFFKNYFCHFLCAWWEAFIVFSWCNLVIYRIQFIPWRSLFLKLILVD